MIWPWPWRRRRSATATRTLAGPAKLAVMSAAVFSGSRLEFVLVPELPGSQDNQVDVPEAVEGAFHQRLVALDVDDVEVHRLDGFGTVALRSLGRPGQPRAWPPCQDDGLATPALDQAINEGLGDLGRTPKDQHRLWFAGCVDHVSDLLAVVRRAVRLVGGRPGCAGLSSAG